MINSMDAFKKIKECLIDGEEILLFSSQLKSWRFIDKFWVIISVICMIFNFFSGIFTIIINPTVYGIGASLIDFAIFLLLLFLHIFLKPLKKMSIKYPESYYAFTNYRIIYVRPNIFWDNRMYWYSFISDVRLSVNSVKNILDYKYVISFMYAANDSYEVGVTCAYKIFLKTKDEVDKIAKIISEHPTKEEKETYYKNFKNPKNIKIITIRHLLESIIMGIGFYFMYGRDSESPILYSFLIFIAFFVILMFAEWISIYTSERELKNK